MTAIAAAFQPASPSRRLSLSLAAASLIVFFACSGFGRLVAPTESASQSPALKIIATVVAHPRAEK